MTMSETDRIIIGFEGESRDLKDFAYDVLGQEFNIHREKETPGGTIILQSLPPLAKSAGGHLIIEIALFISDKIAVPVFVAWLCTKWKKQGEKPITIKIENNLYQFDPTVMTRAIEKAIAEQKKKKTK